jgi:two-component system nitrate/nitrite response regulator NarL
MIRLAIAEDHQCLIDSINLITEFDKDISIVGSVNDGEALLELVRLKQPHVVIVDLRMPKTDGMEASKQILKEFPHIKILIFTMFDIPEAQKQAKAIGVSGYILKNTSLDELITAVKAVYNGQTYFNDDFDVEDTKSKNILTKRQKEILHLIALGKTSREIADMLFIDIKTVNTHRQNMIRVLNLDSKNGLVKYAIENKYQF